MADVVKRKKKQKKCSSIQGTVDIVKDRISGMPDSLIHHILSFLKMKYVIRTSLLSKRWRYLWTSVPVLNFGSWRPTDTTFIDRSLIFYEARKIRRFHVDLSSIVDECHLDSWVRFAIGHDVEELDIFFCYKRLYNFSRHLLECGTLRVLELACCVLNISGSCCLRSLTELRLFCVEITDLDTSGCPLLEKLTMEECHGNINIYAPNKKLRYFEDINLFRLPKNSGLTLYAPYLLSIELAGYDIRQSYSFTNLSSIESASLDFTSEMMYRPYSDYAQLLMELLKNLRHAITLKLCRRCVEFLAHRETNTLKVPLLSATCLELKTPVNKYVLRGISSFLRSSGCLETLIIKINYQELSYDDDYIDEIKSWELLEHAISDLQLKTIMIDDFLLNEREFLLDEWEMNFEVFRRPIESINIDKLLENLAGEMKLVKLLLKGCKVLDKMTIHTTEIPFPSLKSRLLLGLAKKLLILPRASASAEIDFS